MSLAIAEQNGLPAGFAAIDEAYSRYPTSPADTARFGKFVVASTSLLETPADVLEAGEVLTNPSQIETHHGQAFAYFRREPKTLHLGHTYSVPYLIGKDAVGQPQLREFSSAMIVEGEDPRLTRGVKMRSPTGRVHEGWLLSTVVATPLPGNPADVKSIRQDYYWGKSLKNLTKVHEIAGLKNTCVLPVANTRSNDTSLHVFGRPHPHITYSRVACLQDITPQIVNSGINLTEGFLPTNPRVHTGVNTPNRVPGHPGYLRLNAHEAYTPLVAGKKQLHYRLVDYGFQLPCKQYPEGRLIPLGVIATRGQFPDAEPKPPENMVGDYYDVLYGSAGWVAAAVGRTSLMVTGMSDRHVGFATLRRVA